MLKDKLLRTFHIFWVLQVLFLVVNVVLAYNFYRTFSESFALSDSLISSQLKSRELLIVRTSARSFEKIFQNTQGQLNFFSSLLSKPGKLGYSLVPSKELFQSNLDSLDPAVREIGLFSSQGKLSLLVDRKTKTFDKVASLSAEVTDWSNNPKNADKFYVSFPFTTDLGSFHGEKAIFMATTLGSSSPSGTLSYLISLSDFEKNFINPFGKYPYERSLILDSNGAVVVGDSNLVGKNLFKYAQNEKWNGWQDFTKKLQSLLTQSGLQTTWNLKINPKTVRSFLVSSERIDIPNTNRDLYLVIIYPQSSLSRALNPISSFGSKWLAPGIIGALISGVIVLAIRLLLTKKGITS